MNKKIFMYTCGPTVYQPEFHIGNLRTFILSDLIRCSLEIQDFEVVYAMNITDIDKKILDNLKDQNFYDFINANILNTINQLKYFNCIKTKDHILRATNYIPEIVEIILLLEEKNNIYVTDNAVYCKIDKQKYFKLGNSDNKSSRNIIGKDEKINKEDYILWKKSTNDQVFWRTKWMDGICGWHIECSAMIISLLKQYNIKQLDYQIGGKDLKFPHHENSNYLLNLLDYKIDRNIHIGGLLLDSKKMSKSLNNIILPSSLKYSPEELRFFFMCNSLNKEQNFTLNNLKLKSQQFAKIKQKIDKLPNTNNDNLIYFFNKRFDFPAIIAKIFSGDVSKNTAIYFFKKYCLI